MANHRADAFLFFHAELRLAEQRSEAFVGSRHTRTCRRSQFTVDINALTGSVDEY